MANSDAETGCGARSMASSARRELSRLLRAEEKQLARLARRVETEVEDITGFVGADVKVGLVE